MSAPKTDSTNEPETAAPRHFIQQSIDADLAAAKNGGRVHTRFPPEPNGYLHIGHAKAICLNFTLATEYGGKCNLRFDDTNPAKENVEFVESMQTDIHWLGFDWGEKPVFASDNFETLYGWAQHLIREGLAYVDDLSSDEIRAYRGTGRPSSGEKSEGIAPGKNSPHRGRSVEENLDLFARMRAGEFEDGAKTLRAKIDMGHGNLLMRDPVLYRIQRAHHHRTGNDWCIYPMYDWAHGQCDAIEGITHSLCTLEFEIHRPLYDWYLDNIPAPSRPRQIEMARLNLTRTILSKRKLIQLVEEKHVQGWDDPRMPTIAGLRRRGYTPGSIRAFCEEIGVARFNGIIDSVRLENAIREDLNATAERRMAVIDPVKLVITNYPEGDEESFEAGNNPGDEAAGSRQVPFSREVWVEKDDFREEPPKKWRRLAIGKEVRLKYACYVTLTDVIKDPVTGEVTELRATFDPESRGGGTPDERKVRGTIHWVSTRHAVELPVRFYDSLFSTDVPGSETGNFLDDIHPDSLRAAKVWGEPALAEVAVGATVQFERVGYFIADEIDSTSGAPVFNRTVTLRDTWAKMEKKLQANANQ
ncbi:MAG: glutaminyl-tRNA synthetase [Planctomycetota bacterium]|jgi:glutaminyl-tRNA synthetase